MPTQLEELGELQQRFAFLRRQLISLPSKLILYAFTMLYARSRTRKAPAWLVDIVMGMSRQGDASFNQHRLDEAQAELKNAIAELDAFAAQMAAWIDRVVPAVLKREVCSREVAYLRTLEDEKYRAVRVLKAYDVLRRMHYQPPAKVYWLAGGLHERLARKLPGIRQRVLDKYDEVWGLAYGLKSGKSIPGKMGWAEGDLPIGLAGGSAVDWNELYPLWENPGLTQPDGGWSMLPLSQAVDFWVACYESSIGIDKWLLGIARSPEFVTQHQIESTAKAENFTDIISLLGMFIIFLLLGKWLNPRFDHVMSSAFAKPLPVFNKVDQTSAAYVKDYEGLTYWSNFFRTISYMLAIVGNASLLCSDDLRFYPQLALAIACLANFFQELQPFPVRRWVVSMLPASYVDIQDVRNLFKNCSIPNVFSKSQIVDGKQLIIPVTNSGDISKEQMKLLLSHALANNDIEFVLEEDFFTLTTAHKVLSAVIEQFRQELISAYQQLMILHNIESQLTNYHFGAMEWVEDDAGNPRIKLTMRYARGFAKRFNLTVPPHQQKQGAFVFVFQKVLSSEALKQLTRLHDAIKTHQHQTTGTNTYSGNGSSKKPGSPLRTGPKRHAEQEQRPIYQKPAEQHVEWAPGIFWSSLGGCPVGKVQNVDYPLFCLIIGSADECPHSLPFERFREVFSGDVSVVPATGSHGLKSIQREGQRTAATRGGDDGNELPKYKAKLSKNKWRGFFTRCITNSSGDELNIIGRFALKGSTEVYTPAMPPALSRL